MNYDKRCLCFCFRKMLLRITIKKKKKKTNFVVFFLDKAFGKLVSKTISKNIKYTQFNLDK
jgi:cytochrome c oxidase assembly protein Cox11